MIHLPLLLAEDLNLARERHFSLLPIFFLLLLVEFLPFQHPFSFYPLLSWLFLPSLQFASLPSSRQNLIYLCNLLREFFGLEFLYYRLLTEEHEQLFYREHSEFLLRFRQSLVPRQ